jgi:hypothetical protein
MILIPKIVHFIWIGPDPCPYEDNINTYRKHNPGWEIKIWHNDNLPKIHNKRVYKIMNSWAGKSDVLRLEILYNHGGLYVDTDSRCIRALDKMVDGLVCFGMQGHTGKVNNCALGCVPKHPAMKRLVYELDGYVKKLAKTKTNKRKGIHLVDIAGSGYITPILRADPTYTQLDEGLKRGERRLIGTEEDPLVVKSGYILQYPAGSWVKRGQRRIRLGKR